jgi:hypothetical protein
VNRENLLSSIHDLRFTIHVSIAMRLAEESHARLEQFFRWHGRDEKLRLPLMFIHAGFLSHHLTRALRSAAFTIGRHIFVSRAYLEKDERGHLRIRGWLLAHEAAHVRQFQREGFLPFLYNYLREYATFLFRSGKLDAAARRVAYEQITREKEAREVEAAYLEWRLNVTPSTLETVVNRDRRFTLPLHP